MNAMTTALNPTFSPRRRGTIPRVGTLTSGKVSPMDSNEFECERYAILSRGRGKGEGGQCSPAHLVPGFKVRIFWGILILTWLSTLGGHASGTNDAFAQGVELSRAGEFPDSTAAFDKAAQARPAGGT